jgi:hypothetical protein
MILGVCPIKFYKSYSHSKYMGIPGFVDYKRREYCNDVNCPIQLLLNKQQDGSENYEKIREICKQNCISTTYQFHQWLIGHGYLVVKPESKEEQEKG